MQMVYDQQIDEATRIAALNYDIQHEKEEAELESSKRLHDLDAEIEGIMTLWVQNQLMPVYMLCIEQLVMYAFIFL